LSVLQIEPLSFELFEQEERILDFDIETLAAGFADPNWVPQKITVAAWSWVGEEPVEHIITGKEGFWSRKLRGERLAPLVEAIREADALTGHNIIRFDLPVLNAECARCGIDPLPKIRVYDTTRLWRMKGFKKGQDNMSHNFALKEEKMKLDWSEWDAAYEEDGWPVAVERCRTDVIQHKAFRANPDVQKWLRGPSVWRP
jgi:DNA polymerase elongation subunit (family B)